MLVDQLSEHGFAFNRVRCGGGDVRVVAPAYGTFRSHGVGRNALQLRRMSNAYSIVVTEFMTYPLCG